jgi:abhydrolase domain-containing protein 13
MPELVDHLMPKVAVFKSLILRNYWPSIARINEIRCSILFIAGLKDELIPHAHMLKLHEAAVNTPYKEIVIFN